MFRCPKCGAELELVLVEEQRKENEVPMAKGRTWTFRLDFKNYTLSDQDIINAAKNLPYRRTIQKHYIELADVSGRVQQFPVKQVVRKAIEMRYPSQKLGEGFTTHRAFMILKNLGLPTKTRFQ